MIYEALSCLAEDMNEYLRRSLKVKEDKVVLSGIVNQDGSIAIQGENKVLLTLLNIEKENIGKSNGAGTQRTQPFASSALNINLYVVFSSYFSANNYAESLRFLSFVVSFFQYKNVFTKTNTPRLDKGIDKLILEMESPGTERLNNVWATLGAKYMPSVIYKIRMLSFDDTVVHEFRPGVGGVSSENSIQ